MNKAASIVASLLGIVSVAQVAVAQEAAAKLNYNDHLKPLLREVCFGCHNQDKTSGGLNLTTYSSLMAGGSSGAVIEAGDPDSSYLYQLVTHASTPTMPPESPKMADDKLATIQKWIADGALENSGSVAKPTTKKPGLDLAMPADGGSKPEGPPPMPPEMSLEPVVHSKRDTAITALAGSPWAPLVAVAGQGQVLLYNADSLDLIGVLPFPEGVPHVLKFSRNGKLLLAGGGHAAKSGRVVVWDVTTAQRVIEVGEEYDAVLAADISPDQSMIALGGPSKVVRVYSTATGELQYEIKKHTDWIYALEFSPDNVLLATADRNGGLFVWEAAAGREYLALAGHPMAVTDVSWRIDGNLLASCSEDGSVKLWEMNGGSQAKTWNAHGGGAQSVEYCKDGRLATCGRDRLTRIWDGEGKEQKALTPFSDLALRVTWKDDGARVIGGSWTGEIRVWNAADGQQAGTLTANPPPLAGQLEAAQKDFALRKTQNEQSMVAAAAAQAGVDQLAAAQAAKLKMADDLNAAEKVARAEIVQLEQTVATAKAAAAAAQAELPAKQQAATAAAEASTVTAQAAAATPGDAALVDAAAKAKAVADESAAVLAAVQKTIADQTAAADTAQAQIPVRQQAADKAAADAAALRKAMETAPAELQAAQTRAAAVKAAADATAAAVASAERAVQKWTAAVAFAAKASSEQAAVAAPATGG